MVRSSTYKDQQYQIYEMHNEAGHVVTSVEAGANALTVSAIQAHEIAVVDGAGTDYPEYTRIYADGELIDFLLLTNAGVDVSITFAAGVLVTGETLDIFFPATTGNLVSNTGKGKLDLPRLQSVQEWDVEEVTAPVLECGTEREQEIELAVGGRIVLGLNRHGNTALADFIAANEGNSDGTVIYLLIDVVDSTVAVKTHDLLIEAEVESYDRVSRAVNSLQGIITDTITFVFKPDVVTFAET